MAKHKDFWKKVRKTMRECYGIIVKTDVNGKTGYTLL